MIQTENTLAYARSHCRVPPVPLRSLPVGRKRGGILLKKYNKKKKKIKIKMRKEIKDQCRYRYTFYLSFFLFFKPRAHQCA